MFESAFIEILLIKTSECRCQTTKRPDQLDLRSNDCNDQAKSRVTCKLETFFGFNLCFAQPLPRSEEVFNQLVPPISANLNAPTPIPTPAPPPHPITTS